MCLIDSAIYAPPPSEAIFTPFLLNMQLYLFPSRIYKGSSNAPLFALRYSFLKLQIAVFEDCEKVTLCSNVVKQPLRIVTYSYLGNNYTTQKNSPRHSFIA